ncbi:hypothetical protein CANCADRAFT_62169 [Tortispora caseinolytica NRRL Y-17796]|uniref:RIC1 C-terminal alpha solenoid region domain-containing protein n=1 Tax=Tortispora caseinolytica NRRL Y-17796 TaxID=767744 RepID=A0A1E4TBE8_9ASCO|nr:hypothetical protein CANCADRAFT_62169 [Tortispora caseinolytica NRRL Y-17796]
MKWPSSLAGVLRIPGEGNVIDISVSENASILWSVTRTQLICCDTMTLAPVCITTRSANSIEQHGYNVKVKCSHLKCTILTSKGSIFVYSAHFENEQLGLFIDSTYALSNPPDPDTLLSTNPGPGQADGIRRFTVELEATIPGNAIDCCTYDTEVMSISSSQIFIRNVTGHVVKTTRLAYSYDELITTAVAHSYVFFIFTDAIYGTSFQHLSFDFLSHTSEKPLSAAFNEAYNLLYILFESGTWSIYSFEETSLRLLFIKSKRPSIDTGAPFHLSASKSSVLVSYRNFCVQYSIYGAEITAWRNEKSIICSAWSNSKVYLLPDKSSSVSVLDQSTWNVFRNSDAQSIINPALYCHDCRVDVFRGRAINYHKGIDHETPQWLSLNLPLGYIAQNAPLQYIAVSPDCEYVAVSGNYGMSTYSIMSRRWRMFESEHEEQEFSVDGGIVYYGRLLITSVKTRDSHQLWLYNRDEELSSSAVLQKIDVSAKVLHMSIDSAELIVYTESNALIHYHIFGNENKISQIAEISFSGLIESPYDVTQIGWILPERDGKEPLQLILAASFLMLVSGKLMLFYPGNAPHELDEMCLHVKQLADALEYFYACTSGLVKDTIWGYDGEKMLFWLSVSDKLKHDSELTCDSIEVDFYPLSVLVERGIVIGVESKVERQVGSSTSLLFRQQVRSVLFLPKVWKELIRTGKKEDALFLADQYMHLEYFSFALELLLHDVLEEAASSAADSASMQLLNSVVEFLDRFPERLDAIVGCTRKTDAKFWRVLFDFVGPAEALFEDCIQKGKLNIAAGFLLIMHTFEPERDLQKDVKTLLDQAMAAEDWNLCKDIARFADALGHKQQLQEILSM